MFNFIFALYLWQYHWEYMNIEQNSKLDYFNIFKVLKSIKYIQLMIRTFYEFSLLSGQTFGEFLRLIFWKIHSYDNFARFQKINFKNAPNLSGTQETPLKSVRLAIIWTTHKLLYLCNIEKACPNWWRFRFQKSATNRCSMLENASTEYITSKTSLYTSGDSVERVV